MGAGCWLGNGGGGNGGGNTLVCFQQKQNMNKTCWRLPTQFTHNKQDAQLEQVSQEAVQLQQQQQQLKDHITMLENALCHAEVRYVCG